MKKHYIALLGLLTLVGCTTAPTTFEPKTQVTVVTKVVYPEFPPIRIPDPVPLLPFEFDVPRDMSRHVVKNVESCVKTPEASMDKAFWARCGEYPPLAKSNIFVGLDKRNFDIMSLNFKTLQESNFVLREKLKIANQQREEWLKKAEAERNVQSNDVKTQ